MVTLSTLTVSALTGLMTIGLPSASAQEAPAHISVVELFTSQGCSACPPADRLLSQLSERAGVIALSFPVSYWDYLGWKDTLARPENALRQREYAAILNSGQVYTPEVVVNGMKVCVGSDLAAIDSALQTTAAALRKHAVPLFVRVEGGRLIIETGAAPEGSKHRLGKIFVAAVRRSFSVSIGSGENRGRTVTYTNVVRRLTSAGEWQGAPTSYAISLSSLPKDGDMLVVFLQMDKLGPILAAAQTDG